MKKEKLYLVMNSNGDWDNYYEYVLFATKDKDYAEKYIGKFSKLIDKIKNTLEPYTEKDNGFRHIKEEYYNSWQYLRWEQLRNLGEPFIKEIELR